jgi:3-oxoacyl-(acyl-carrier-protein) synthase
MTSIIDTVSTIDTASMTDTASLADAAGASGLAVAAAASWPESEEDDVAPSPAGFVVSSFSPVIAAVADRCLGRRISAGEPVTAVILVSSLGDVVSAVHVARAVDDGKRVLPLLFFQSVPNAVAGHVAAKWRLTGPVMCVGDVSDALDAAALLIEDGDADEALLVHMEQAFSEGTRDRAQAVLLQAGAQHSEGVRP